MSRPAKGTVRIVAGARRGQRVHVPRGVEIRPTGERVREAVFDVLGSVWGLTVLDLFAGTGALGLEAMSRGAGACVFVEQDRSVTVVLRANIEKLAYSESCRVVEADYRRAARGFIRSGEQFDLLFVDPPYRILAEVEAELAPMVGSLLSPQGVIVVEGPQSIRSALGASPIFERDYGDTRITMIASKE